MSVKHFVITGVTVSGNMGGAAMLLATLQQLRKRYPGSQFTLFSIYPDRDKEQNAEPDLEIVSTSPVWLLAVLAPLAFAGLLGSAVRRFLAARMQYFRALSSADAVIDLSGIAFVDGRGLPLLWYNIACAAPGALFGVPVFKLSQALGPFRSLPNRICARWTLARCAEVVARGSMSFDHLRDLGLPRIHFLPDVSFAMDVPPQAVESARGVYSKFCSRDVTWIVVSPSQVVNQLCAAKGIDFLSEMRAFISGLLERTDAHILVLPHSLGKGGSKNNDIDICRRLHAECSSERVHLHIASEDPVLLRAIIGQSSFFIGCRFHAVVAALAMGVPTLILGWSHKYAEMAAAFDANIPSVDFSGFSSQKLLELFDSFWAVREQTRARLNVTRVTVREDAGRNYDLVRTFLDGAHAPQ